MLFDVAGFFAVSVILAPVAPAMISLMLVLAAVLPLVSGLCSATMLETGVFSTRFGTVTVVLTDGTEVAGMEAVKDTFLDVF